MKRRRGYSIVETLLAISIISFVITATAQLTMNLGRAYGRASTQLGVDQSASRGVQWLTRDLQEAKQVDILSPTHIRIEFPVVLPDGSYNRAVLDPTTAIDYFRGDADGLEDPNGDRLVREPAGGNPRSVCRNVTEVDFESANPSSVDVTLRVQTTTANRTVQCEMIHRAIFLRNY